MKNWILLFIVLGTAGCAQRQAQKLEEWMGQASGARGEVILVMDSTLWQNELGKAVKEVFTAPIPGLPQDEPLFRLHRVNPFKFNSVLKETKNLIFVSTLQEGGKENKLIKRYYDKAALMKLSKNPSLFMHTENNLFAKGQKVLHLFGKDSKELTENIKNNRQLLTRYFENAEMTRVQRKIYQNGDNKDLRVGIEKKHGFILKVPLGYQLADDKEGFVWLRGFGKGLKDSNIVIAYKDYSSQESFLPKNIISWRDSLGKSYIWGNEKDSYMKTEMGYPPDIKQVNFNNQYGKEMRGLWKLNDQSMGGAFLSYVTVDERQGRIYYIEGFAYNPGGKKGGMIRELEAILKTFKIG